MGYRSPDRRVEQNKARNSYQDVIDLGCGSGAIGNMFVRERKSVVGIDLVARPGCNFPVMIADVLRMNPTPLSETT